MTGIQANSDKLRFGVDPEVEVYSIEMQHDDDDAWPAVHFTNYLHEKKRDERSSGTINANDDDDISSIDVDFHFQPQDQEATNVAHQLCTRIESGSGSFDSMAASTAPTATGPSSPSRSKSSTPAPNASARSRFHCTGSDPNDCCVVPDADMLYSDLDDVSFTQESNTVFTWNSEEDSLFYLGGSEITQDLEKSINAIREEASRVDSVMVLHELDSTKAELDQARKEIRDRAAEILELKALLHKRDDQLSTLELERDLYRAEASSFTSRAMTVANVSTDRSEGTTRSCGVNLNGVGSRRQDGLIGPAGEDSDEVRVHFSETVRAEDPTSHSAAQPSSLSGLSAEGEGSTGTPFSGSTQYQRREMFSVPILAASNAVILAPRLTTSKHRPPTRTLSNLTPPRRREVLGAEPRSREVEGGEDAISFVSSSSSSFGSLQLKNRNKQPGLQASVGSSPSTASRGLERQSPRRQLKERASPGLSAFSPSPISTAQQRKMSAPETSSVQEESCLLDSIIRPADRDRTNTKVFIPRYRPLPVPKQIFQRNRQRYPDHAAQGASSVSEAASALLPRVTLGSSSGLAHHAREANDRLASSELTVAELRRRLALISRYYEQVMVRLQQVSVETKAEKSQMETQLRNEIVAWEQRYNRLLQAHNAQA
jgi:hypothetical protein